MCIKERFCVCWRLSGAVGDWVLLLEIEQCCWRLSAAVFFVGDFYFFGVSGVITFIKNESEKKCLWKIFKRQNRVILSQTICMNFFTFVFNIKVFIGLTVFSRKISISTQSNTSHIFKNVNLKYFGFSSEDNYLIFLYPL